MTETTASQRVTDTAAAAAEDLVRAEVRALMAGQPPWAVMSRRQRPAVVAVLALLPAGHPVAEVARRSCREFGHLITTGCVACGPCWEHAIRTDEQFVISCGLSEADQRPDPDYVDEIAVERAIAGEPVRLTETERREVIRRMRLGGYSPSITAKHARVSARRMQELTRELAAVEGVSPSEVA